MEYLNKATTVIKELVETSVALLALAVVLQVLFGANTAFFPVDVVGNVVHVTKSLGAEGLVGLASLWVLLALFNRK